MIDDESITKLIPNKSIDLHLGTEENPTGFKISHPFMQDTTLYEVTNWGGNVFKGYVSFEEASVFLGSNATLFDFNIVNDQGLVNKKYVDDAVTRLEDTLKNILSIIQSGNLDTETVGAIEQTIVSYFENKTVMEVEG